MPGIPRSIFTGDSHYVRLRQAVAAYAAAIDNLPDQADLGADGALAALLARDALARLLAAGDPLSLSSLRQVAALDATLREHGPALLRAITPAAWQQWRQACSAPPTHWWWDLDETQAPARRVSPAWGVAAGFCVLISFSLIVEIGIRFLSSGADFLGVFSSLFQIVVALLATSTLTETGREALQRAFASLHIAPGKQHYWQLGFAALLLAALVAFRLSFPALARLYNERGVRLQQAGQITSAIAGYRRAVGLLPDYAQAHYNLATAYEDILAYDQAITEYQTAVEADPGLYLAYNNLARLYMLRKGDFASALQLLDAGLRRQVDLPPDAYGRVQYAFLKNRGWAYMGLRYLGLAEADLRAAVAQRSDAAGAHCLLAQVLEAQAQATATGEWEACLRYYSPGEDPVEADWLGRAREILRAKEGAS